MTTKKAQTTESIKNLLKKIRASNAKFEKMTKAERKAAVAKDVIALIDSGFFKVKTDMYLEAPTVFKGDYSSSTSDMLSDKDLSDVLTEKAKKNACRVCAVGATFVATVMKRDQLNYNANGYSDDNMLEYLEDIFSGQELRMMERAFEAIEDGQAFGESFNSDELRLRAIMNIIIKNNGKFILPKSPSKNITYGEYRLNDNSDWYHSPADLKNFAKGEKANASSKKALARADKLMADAQKWEDWQKEMVALAGNTGRLAAAK